MTRRLLFVALTVLLVMGAFITGCKKDDPANPDATYPVTALVLNPQGDPQGGALLTLKNPPSNDPKFSSFTDAAGMATIQSPAGQQVLIASIGSAFLTEIPVNVAANPAGTNAGTIRLAQNTTVRVLVIKASAEQLETVLRIVGFSSYDSTTINAMRDSANVDSTRFLNFLKQYTLIFSNCHGGTEGGSAYALLSRVYGRYIESGGKMYGGHYNYFHLQRIWSTFYTQFNNQGSPSTDTLKIIDANLSNFVGFSVASWATSLDSRRLSGYEKFSNLPTNAKVYGVIKNTSPEVGVIVENYVGTGKYLWTDYHNQDIRNSATLVKLVQYFLLTM
ncbi:MAG: hypothetical protein KF749_14805 [Bacteroidetes bacterium]|nr:hypothetical protein [Bacteroidota bacterium]MCW5894267.1 hypothetical protein [Bacteroidota bacterium]